MGELHEDDPIKASKRLLPKAVYATYNFNLLEWGGLSLDGLTDAINMRLRHLMVQVD